MVGQWRKVREEEGRKRACFGRRVHLPRDAVHDFSVPGLGILGEISDLKFLI